MKTLEELKKDKRWVSYLLTTKNGKKTKIPISPVTQKGASSVRESDWDTYDRCVNFTKEKNYSGEGIVLIDDGLTCVDLDNCIENGKINKDAQWIINELDSYTERSVSGTGVHIFLYSNEEFDKTRFSKTKIPIEIYKKNRYIVFTNDVINNKGFEERTAQLRKVYNTFFIIQPFIDKIKKDNYDYEKFKKLNKLDFSDYNDDHSAADLGYMNLIAKYVNTKEEAVIIFKASPLVRAKFLDRPEYVEGLLKKVEKRLDKNYNEYKKEVEKSHILTDDDVCSMVFKKYPKTFTYNADTGKYYFYKINHYEEDKIFLLIKCAKCVVKNFLNNSDWSEKSKNTIRKDFLSAKGSKNIETVYKEIGYVAKRQEQFNKHKSLLCCKNCIVDLETGEPLPLSPDYLFTYHTDINYKKGLTIEGTEFKKFLTRITNGDKEKMLYLQILAGYSLTGDTSEQSFYYFYGPGATGKSVLAKIFTMLAGTFSFTLPSCILDSKNKDGLTLLAPASDRRLIVITEQDSNTKMNTGMVKQLTGEDKSTARHLYQEIFDYIPIFKIIICSNEIPIIDCDRDSIERRLKIIPFTNVIPQEERDKRLMEKLEKEKEFILPWAVEGAVSFYKNGFLKPAFLKEASDALFYEQNPLASWIEAHYNFDEKNFVTSESLWEDYNNYCELHNTYRVFNTRDHLIKSLKKQYGFESNNRAPRGLYGLRSKFKL